MTACGTESFAPRPRGRGRARRISRIRFFQMSLALPLVLPIAAAAVALLAAVVLGDGLPVQVDGEVGGLLVGAVMTLLGSLSPIFSVPYAILAWGTLRLLRSHGERSYWVASLLLPVAFALSVGLIMALTTVAVFLRDGLPPSEGIAVGVHWGQVSLGIAACYVALTYLLLALLSALKLVGGPVESADAVGAAAPRGVPAGGSGPSADTNG